MTLVCDLMADEKLMTWPYEKLAFGAWIVGTDMSLQFVITYEFLKN